ncbi:DUF6065 family protein [Phaeobacter sp. J2-8]|uniref:DUF6065 family protein n=1 Tax=Phaeobacter sp. J2-8 TaxID=2931394 RepID=UPI001FD1F3A9|nr:DUF6065 family protein [Phaeobacter sp. J2-8]MCJ7872775.1 DUF6065 family protein [Phaeobacter sp. J2-8]
MLTFYSVHDDLKPPMKADTGALGRLPLSAFQYCEALRTASALGWYVFPPRDFSLLFDGKEVFLADESEWRALRSEPLGPEMETAWEKDFAADYGPLPNFLEDLSDTGIVQIWTGYFVKTDPGEALQIRPLANVHTKSAYWCYEGIVETDHFAPCPLFINIQLTRTMSEIFFPRDFPLFQVAVLQKADLKKNAQHAVHSIFDADFPTAGLANTLRSASNPRKAPGQYGANIRRNSKSRCPRG